MEFKEKVESFFLQLQIHLFIQHFQEIGNYNNSIIPSLYSELSKDYNIKFPFCIDAEIFDIKSLISKEKINTIEALKVITGFKEIYEWKPLGLLTQESYSQIKKAPKALPGDTWIKDMGVRHNEALKILLERRDLIYNDLIEAVNSLPTINDTPLEQKYNIGEYNNKLMEIYNHCNTVIFNCTYPIFLQSVGAANFTQLNAKIPTKVAVLMYRLKYVIGEDWYTDICNCMQWNKTYCSAKNSQLKDQKWNRQLAKIILIPEKE